jgi:hypothetical protein
MSFAGQTLAKDPRLEASLGAQKVRGTVRKALLTDLSKSELDLG